MIATSTVRSLLAAAAFVALTSAAFSQNKSVTIVTSSDSIAGTTARTVGAMGFYGKHGIDAKVTPLESSTLAAAALISGSANFATIAPSDLVLARSRGQDIVALFTHYTGFATVLVLSKAAVEKLKVSPTAPLNERFKALDGLSIGSQSPTSTVSIAVASSAKQAGATVKLVFMGQPAAVAALQAGAIDGFGGSAPYYVQPVLNGSGVIWVNGPKGEFPKQFIPNHSSYLVTTRAYAQANPDIVKNVVAAFGDYGKTALERPADIKTALAKLFPSIDDKTFDLLLATENQGFALRKITIEDVTHDIEFVKASGAQAPGIENLKPADMLYP